ncbi:MAG: 1-acyl-sn-glycerol-3-phosphate acyltransferase [Flavobacteriales bacterium]|nr:1-acyl-sn-glycerol-3-phosphate acyltransferase [Flavobacteriales bacterium]
MIYAIFKFIFKITVQSYFRNIGIKGAEKIPMNGPEVFVANHPSAFMDPIVVGAFAKRTLHFIAAGEFFGKGLKAWFYKTQFNMIPVYRPNKMPGQVHKNKEMFQTCFDHLSSGGCLLIFPEGVSITEKRLQEIKTGVARMTYGAEQQNAFNLGVKIVPVGLNYSNPHEFRSDLFVQIGDPIEVANYEGSDPDDWQIIKNITEDVEVALRKTVLHINQQDLDTLVDKVDQVFEPELNQLYAISRKDAATDFKKQQEVIEAVHHFEESGEVNLEEIESQIDEYFEGLNRFGITNAGLIHQRTTTPLLSYIKLFFGLPFFILGWLSNAVPYYLTKLIINTVKIDDAFKGSVMMAVGTLAYLLFFIAGGWWVYSQTGEAIYVALFVLGTYALGLFTLKYSGWFGDFLEHRRLRRMVEDERQSLVKLYTMREEIVKLLEGYRLQFMSEQESDD